MGAVTGAAVATVVEGTTLLVPLLGSIPWLMSYRQLASVQHHTQYTPAMGSRGSQISGLDLCLVRQDSHSCGKTKFNISMKRIKKKNPC
jgi:hypothetical protein